MSEYDVDLSDEKPITSEAEKKGLTREQAIAWGRRLGEDEANRRGEIGTIRAERVARAEAYAAWDYDGRPAKGQPKYVLPGFKPDFKGGK